MGSDETALLVCLTGLTRSRVIVSKTEEGENAIQADT